MDCYIHMHVFIRSVCTLAAKARGWKRESGRDECVVILSEKQTHTGQKTKLQNEAT